MSTTYILYSPILDKYYVGSTRGNLAERIRRHSTNHKGYTGRASDWEVVYSQVFVAYQEAHAFEATIKSWKSRRMIEKLISSKLR